MIPETKPTADATFEGEGQGFTPEPEPKERKCAHCNGRGYFGEYDGPQSCDCPYCGGRGFVPDPEPNAQVKPLIADILGAHFALATLSAKPGKA